MRTILIPFVTFFSEFHSFFQTAQNHESPHVGLSFVLYTGGRREHCSLLCNDFVKYFYIKIIIYAWLVRVSNIFISNPTSSTTQLYTYSIYHYVFTYLDLFKNSTLWRSFISFYIASNYKTKKLDHWFYKYRFSWWLLHVRLSLSGLSITLYYIILRRWSM